MLVVATPVDAGEIWSARVSLGYSENLRMLSHEIEIGSVVAYARDVVRARNHAVFRILREFPAMTHTLWWDEDNWPEERRIVTEMIDSGYNVIGAPYTSKKQPLRWIHQHLDPVPPIVNGSLEVRSVGLGFTMMTRWCLEHMVAKHRRYREWPSEDRVANIFGHLYEGPEGCAEEDEALRSEDFSFCKRWRALGGRVMLKTDAGIVYHAGPHGWSAREMRGGMLGA